MASDTSVDPSSVTASLLSGNFSCPGPRVRVCVYVCVCVCVLVARVDVSFRYTELVSLHPVIFLSHPSFIALVALCCTYLILGDCGFCSLVILEQRYTFHFIDPRCRWQNK